MPRAREISAAAASGSADRAESAPSPAAGKPASPPPAAAPTATMPPAPVAAPQQPCFIGQQSIVVCQRCGGTLQLMAAGTASPRAMAAVIRGTEAARTWYMFIVAQAGTRLLVVAALCLMLCGCHRVTTVQPDAGNDAGTSRRDAGACSPAVCPLGKLWSREDCGCVAQASLDECRGHTDCVLLGRGCCGSCLPPTRDEVRAVTKAQFEEAYKSECPSPVHCGQCYVSDPEPLAPLFEAACIARRCELVDMRADDISRCDSDSDCAAVSRGCCPAHSSAPADYVGVRSGADRSLLECTPAQPCVPPDAQQPIPIAFCAEDGHCAVRRRETLNGVESSDCYSPTQNVDRAYRPDATGCDCEPFSLPVCRADGRGNLVTLVCLTGTGWISGEDGPCDPQQRNQP